MSVMITSGLEDIGYGQTDGVTVEVHRGVGCLYALGNAVIIACRDADMCPVIADLSTCAEFESVEPVVLLEHVRRCLGVFG